MSEDDVNGCTPNDIAYANNVEAGPASSAANDKIYERKTTSKVIRVLTVLAYVLFVSLAAIMLSLYYIFLWEPAVPERGRLEARVDPRDNFTIPPAASENHSKC